MDIPFADNIYPFRPWRPEDGRVFYNTFAFDCETTLIDDDRPWMPPAFVLAAGFDGQHGVFVTRDRLREFLRHHDGVPVVMHSAAFDLSVIDQVVPQFDIYRWVEMSRVWDTLILHRLLVLGSEGGTANGKGESTLESCADRYLGLKLPKDVVDAAGKPVRLSYGQWLGRSPAEITTPYLHYLALDSVATFFIYKELRSRLQPLLNGSRDTWGYVSPEWLEEQIHRWGPQTHHIQLRAKIVLERISAHGLHIDQHRHHDVVAKIGAVVEEQRELLRGYGYLPGEGSQKALQSIFRRLAWDHPEINFLRTAKTGQFATTHEALSEIASSEPFAAILQHYRQAEKLQNSFLTKMARGVLHPSFDVLARTGRTTSFGEINAQNLPRDDRVRRCFVPSPGHVFLILDFKTIELGTLAQAVQSQFGLQSKMAEAINRGEDLHAIVAAHMAGKPVSEVTKDERQKAKVINFGKPGGMGNATLSRCAKLLYDVILTEAEAEALSNSWMDRFPEMVQFLDDGDAGLSVAEVLGLTPADHYQFTGETKFIGHPENEGREEKPNPIMGWMALKTYRDEMPTTQDGVPYSAATVGYFWDKLKESSSEFPADSQTDIENERPSLELRRAVLNLTGRAGVFILTGRLRANATYTARHNTVFQGLAADGAKLALWLVWRAGYRIVNFIHDELVVEIPENSRLALHAEIVRHLMIRGMKMVVPDVRIDVDYAVSTCWSKNATLVLDPDGRIAPWSPPAAA